jgi:acyl carrier protein
MKWQLSPEDQPLAPYAEALARVLGENPDLTLHVPLGDIRPDHRLKDDLGMDSVQIVSVLYELEGEYSHLNEDHLSNWVRIRDILSSMANAQ